MALGLLLPIRIIQGIFSVIILGLSGYVAHWYDTETLTPSPSQINFLLFVPLFSLISLVYLEVIPRFLPRASHPYAHLALSFINAIFYFAGFVALGSFLGKLIFCRGTVCFSARADAVFAAFSWILWTGTTAVLAMPLFKDGLKSLRDAKTDEIAQKAMKEEAKGGFGSSRV